MQQQNGLKNALLRAFTGTAKAAVGAYAQKQSATTGSGRRVRRAKRRQSDCSPCAAMAAVDEAHKRVRNGTL